MRHLPGEIPEPHQHIFEAINHEVTWLHAIWKVYRQLYAEKETVELLNKVAPAWARIQQDALLDDVMLSLTRLTDPPETGKRENLVLDLLEPLALAGGQNQLVHDVRAALSSAKLACNELRTHRNKRLAHNDLATSLATTGISLPSRQMIETALTMIRDVMNTLNMHFRGGPTIYEAVGLQGDATSLVGCVHDGLRLRRLRRTHRHMSDVELHRAIDERGPMKDEDAGDK